MADRPEMMAPTIGVFGDPDGRVNGAMQNVVEGTLVAMATTFGLGAENRSIVAYRLVLFSLIMHVWCYFVLQLCNEVVFLRVYNTTTPPPLHSPPDPWSRSPPATATLCPDTPDTVLQVQDIRQEVLTSPASSRCCCGPSRTPPAARTRRRGTLARPDSVNRRRLRPTTSWALRTSVSSLPGCCLVPLNGPGIYRSFPTSRYACFHRFYLPYNVHSPWRFSYDYEFASVVPPTCPICSLIT